MGAFPKKEEKANIAWAKRINLKTENWSEKERTRQKCQIWKMITLPSLQNQFKQVWFRIIYAKLYWEIYPILLDCWTQGGSC